MTMPDKDRLQRLAGINEVTDQQAKTFKQEFDLAQKLLKEITSMLKKAKSEHDKETLEDDWAHITRMYKINDGLRKAWSHLKYTSLEDERRRR
jgi:hypothetical protein